MKSSVMVLCAVLSAVAIVNVVRAQIVFPDGTQQTTAFRATLVPPGTAFAEVVLAGTNVSLLPIGFDAVPSGQELVILQVRLPLSTGIPSHYTLESRWPSPNEATDPIDLVYAATPNGASAVNSIAPSVVQFPDGTVVVGGGRQLWVQFRSRQFDPVFTQMSFPVSVLGYFRDKP